MKVGDCFVFASCAIFCRIGVFVAPGMMLIAFFDFARKKSLFAKDAVRLINAALEAE